MMKYIINESRLNSLIKEFIYSTIVKKDLKKYNFVDDIEVYHVKDNKFLVEVVVNREEAIELSAGWGPSWNSFSSRILKTVPLFFNISVILTHRLNKL